MGSALPSNRDLDELFARAQSIRIRARGPDGIDPAVGPVVVEFGANDVERVRTALRIREGGDEFHCMCLGDLSIDLRGRWRSIEKLSFHHGISLRRDGWSTDAFLEDGPALLRLLAERGVAEPLRSFEIDQEAAREGARRRQGWLEAAPAAIRAELPALERGSIDAVLATLRDAEPDDTRVAREVLAWLATGAGPWSGYPAYEELPLKVLAQLGVERIVAAAMTDPNPAIDRAAARFFASRDMVSFRKSVLAEVPDAFFDRARDAVVAQNAGDNVWRFEHAVRVAQATRARRSQTAAYSIGGDCRVIGESIDGPLQGLTTLGNDRLISTDIRTLVRFDPESIHATRVAVAPEHFILLARAGERLVWATMNVGEVHALAPDGTIERWASGQRVPVEMTASGDDVAWICRDAPSGNEVTVCTRDHRAPRVVASVRHTWMLGAGPDEVFFLIDGWKAAGELHAVPWEGGAVRRVCAIPLVGPSMGSPRVVWSDSELLVGASDRVLAIDPRTGRCRELARANAHVHALAANDTHVAMVVGGDGDRDAWEFAVVARTGGTVRRIGRFDRAPYHRHALVIARGAACCTAGDRLIAAALT